MSSYVDRVGQRIDGWTITRDIGRSKRGRVIWELVHDNGRVIRRHTYAVVRMARLAGVPKP